MGWLVIESLDTQPANTQSSVALGEGLRELHGVIGDAHGWHQDNACGRTPQPNSPLADGRAFQRERRLLPLTQACYQQGLLNGALRRRVEHQAEQLETWLPDSSASLIHGDLWSGNVLTTTRGPALIDPAVYRHYPDVDLAMLTLFGSPSAPFLMLTGTAISQPTGQDAKRCFSFIHCLTICCYLVQGITVPLNAAWQYWKLLRVNGAAFGGAIVVMVLIFSLY